METPIETVERFIDYAKSDSLQGRINSMHDWLTSARTFAEENGFSPIKSELEEIERRTYMKAADIMMQASTENYKVGRFDRATYYLNVAKEHLKRI